MAFTSAESNPTSAGGLHDAWRPERMAKSIIVTFPHELGVAEAKRRITDQVAIMKKAYIDKIGTGEIAWVADTAHLRVSAVGQTTTAEIAVMPAEIRVEVHLPWLLAALAGKIEGLLKSNAQEALRIGPSKKG